MKWIFKRQDDVERGFRAGRARPSSELVQQIEARVQAESRSREPRRSLRFAPAMVVTAAALVALSAVGGVSYAATKVESAVGAVGHVMGLQSSMRVAVSTSGRDQYRSGYGWGSPGHTHSGAPSLGQAGSLLPPLLATIKIPTAYVSSTFTIDEQAHLWISVIDENGVELLITQKKSHIGEGIHGVQAKNINYLVLVPRTIGIRLAIPKNLLVPGKHYRIRIIARSHNFQKKTLYIGFTMPAV